jgi:cytochrome P450 family 628
LGILYGIQRPIFPAVKELHEKHGDFVRVRPWELDVCSLSAVNTVFGSTSLCNKGSWYDGTHMGDSSTVHITIDKSPEGHSWKRRIWDVALPSKSLREYEPRVLRYVNELIQSPERERAKGSGVVDIGMYFSFFIFDVMGDLA